MLDLVRKSPIALTLAVVGVLGSTTLAQQATGWRGKNTSSNAFDWSNADNWDNGVPGGDVRDLYFGNTYNNVGGYILTPYNNLSNYAGFRITFESNAPTFTLNGNAVTLFDFNGVPKIENKSSVNQIVNMPVSFSSGGAGEINAVNGNLTFGGTVSGVGGTALKMYGSGRVVTFNQPVGGTNSTLEIVDGNTAVFAAVNTYSGTTTLQSANSVLKVANGGVLGSGNVVLNAGTLQFDRNSSLTVNNGISGAGAVKLTGTGKIILNNGNTYGGGTTITAGTLLAAASNATGSGAITVGDGVNANTGILAGAVSLNNGTNALAVAQGGTITAGAGLGAGDSVGTLASGSQIWNGGGTYAFNIASTAGSTDAAGPTAGFTANAGTNWDRLKMSTLALTATDSSRFTIKVIAPAGLTFATGAKFEIANISGALTATDFANAFVLDTSAIGLSNANFSISQAAATGTGESGTNLFLNYSGSSAQSAPEPASAALACLAAVGLLGVRRGRRPRRGGQPAAPGV